jgi:hypothetical protein
MSAVPAGFVADSFRWGSSSAPWVETVVIMAVIAVMALACVLVLRSLRRRDRRPAAVSDQWQALAVMGDLCPRGWQAQITLYGSTAVMPSDAPHYDVAPVEIEWKQFDGEPRRIAVARRLWAPSIEAALQMMAEDRRTDIAIEQIERAVAEEADAR